MGVEFAKQMLHLKRLSMKTDEIGGGSWACGAMTMNEVEGFSG